MTESFYKCLRDSKLQNIFGWVLLKAANGVEIPCVGLLEIDMEVAAKVFKKVCVIVVKDPIDSSTSERKKMVPGVIGCNLLQKMIAGQNLEKAFSFLTTLSQESQALANQVKMFQNKVTWTEKVEAQVSQGLTSRVGFVRVHCRRNSPMTVPAKTAVTLVGTTLYLPDGYDVVVEPTDLPSVPDGLIVCPTFAKTRNNRVSFRVMNLSQQAYTFHHTQKIAEVSLREVELPVIDINLHQVSDLGSVVEGQVSQVTVAGDSEDEKWISTVDVDESLSSSERSRVLSLIRDFHDVFSKSDRDLGHCTIGKHSITTEDNVAVKLPDRRIAPQMVPEVKKILQNWLQDGIIKESNSPYASQLVLVRKKCGKIRACLDFRLLNNKTIKDAFPLPSTDMALDSLKGARFFSALDLTQGYLQVPMDERDQHKTVFRALGGLYEFCRMPFRLCNAGSTFSRVMNKMMSDYVFDILILFLDDVLVYVESFEGMMLNLAKVFQRLREHNMKLQPSMCHLFKRIIRYLGHEVSENGVHTDPEKIRAIREYPVPETVADVRSFLGLCSYYRNSCCQSAFENLKEKLGSAPV